MLHQMNVKDYVVKIKFLINYNQCLSGKEQFAPDANIVLLMHCIKY